MASDIFDGLYEAERSWSMLDPKPILCYLSKFDEYIVVWNGAVMPYSYALCLASERYQVYTSPAMLASMHKTYTKLYYAGAFGRAANWQAIIQERRTYGYLKLFMKNHLDTLCANKSAAEMMGWFDMDNAKVL